MKRIPSLVKGIVVEHSHPHSIPPLQKLEDPTAWTTPGRVMCHVPGTGGESQGASDGQSQGSFDGQGSTSFTNEP